MIGDVAIDDVPLRLTVEFSEIADLDQPHGILAGTSTVTNVGASPLDVTTGPGPDVELIQQSRVITDSIPQHAMAVTFTLPPGASNTQQAFVHLWSSIPRGRATPGRYQLYASQRFRVDEASERATVIDLRAGPYEIELPES